MSNSRLGIGINQKSGHVQRAHRLIGFFGLGFMEGCFRWVFGRRLAVVVDPPVTDVPAVVAFSDLEVAGFGFEAFSFIAADPEQ